MRGTIGWLVAGAGLLSVAFTAGLFAGCKGDVAEGPEGGTTSSSGSGSTSGSSGGIGSSGSSSGMSSGGSGSSSGSTTSSSSGGGDSCGSPGVTCTVPPGSPGAGAPSSKSHNYAVHTLYIGDTDRTGVVNSSAWKAYGYNLDGVVTAKTSTNVCTLAAGASKSTQVDGNGGIDNSFGENILPIYITIVGSDLSAQINSSLQAGQSTMMTYVTGFDDSAGNKANAVGLGGVLLTGGSYAGGAPAWDVTTHWPILPLNIKGCTPTSGCPAGTDPVANAQVRFPGAYQKGGTFVSGTPTDFVFSLGQGAPIAFPLHSATITFAPKAPGSVTDGTIAGVMITTEFITSLQAVAGHISTSLCSGSAFQSIAQQIEQASDIIYDATGTISNHAGTSCNAISVGLGFEATEIAAPGAADIAPPQSPAPDPCGD